jgi:hypothetical protein
MVDSPASRAFDLQYIELADFGQQAVTTATT